MKYLFVGVWHGEVPEVDHRQTERLSGAENAAIEMTLHAERQDVPDEVLVIENNKVIYAYTKDQQYTQLDFDKWQNEGWRAYL